MLNAHFVFRIRRKRFETQNAHFYSGAKFFDLSHKALKYAQNGSSGQDWPRFHGKAKNAHSLILKLLKVNVLC